MKVKYLVAAMVFALASQSGVADTNTDQSMELRVGNDSLNKQPQD